MLSPSSTRGAPVVTEDIIKQTKHVQRLQEMCIGLLKQYNELNVRIKQKEKTEEKFDIGGTNSESSMSIMQYKLSAVEFYRNILERNLQSIETCINSNSRSDRVSISKTEIMELIQAQKENLSKMKNLQESKDEKSPTAKHTSKSTEKNRNDRLAPPRQSISHSRVYSSNEFDLSVREKSVSPRKISVTSGTLGKPRIPSQRSTSQLTNLTRENSEHKIRPKEIMAASKSTRLLPKTPSSGKVSLNEPNLSPNPQDKNNHTKNSPAKQEIESKELNEKTAELKQIQKEVSKVSDEYQALKNTFHDKREQLTKEIEENKKLKEAINEKMATFQTKVNAITSDIERLRVSNRELRNKINEIDSSINRGLEQIEQKKKQLENSVKNKQQVVNAKMSELEKTKSQNTFKTQRPSSQAETPDDGKKTLKSSRTSPISLTIDGLIENMEIEKHNTGGIRKYSCDDALVNLQRFIEDDDNSDDGIYDMPVKDTNSPPKPNVSQSAPLNQRKLPNYAKNNEDDDFSDLPRSANSAKLNIPAIPQKKNAAVSFNDERKTMVHSPSKSIIDFKESDGSDFSNLDFSSESSNMNAVQENNSARTLPKFSLMEDPKYINEEPINNNKKEEQRTSSVTIASPDTNGRRSPPKVGFAPIRRHGSFLVLSGSDYFSLRNNQINSPSPVNNKKKASDTDCIESPSKELKPLQITPPPKKMVHLKDDSDSDNEFSDLRNSSLSPKTCLSLNPAENEAKKSPENEKRKSPDAEPRKTPENETRKSPREDSLRRMSNNSCDEDDYYAQRPREYIPPAPSNDPNLLKHAEGDFAIDNFDDLNSTNGPISIKPLRGSMPNLAAMTPKAGGRAPPRGTKMHRRASTFELTHYIEETKPVKESITAEPVSVEDNPVDLSHLIDMIPDDMRKGPRTEIFFDEQHKFDYDNLVLQLRRHNKVMSFAHFEYPPNIINTQEMLQLFDEF